MYLKLKLWFKIFQKTEGQDQMTSEANSVRHLVKSQYLSFRNYSKNLQRRGHSSNSSYEATITLIPQADKYATKKESYRAISMMNIGTKFSTKQ